jgi:hypothetical protein
MEHSAAVKGPPFLALAIAHRRKTTIVMACLTIREIPRVRAPSETSKPAAPTQGATGLGNVVQANKSVKAAP